MSPRRTAAEVERSRDAHRAELESALAALKTSTKRAGDVQGYVDQYAEQARAKVLGPIENDQGELATGALAVGFVVGGGVSGTLRMPFKLVRVALGRPSSRSQLEAAMRQDKHSKKLGRALAAVAAADGQLRSRRRRVRRLVPTARRLVLLGSAAGGIFMAMADEETRQNVETETKALLETVRDEVAARLDKVGK